MNNKEIQRFTEQRYKNTYKKNKNFCKRKKKSKNEILWGFLPKR